MFPFNSSMPIPPAANNGGNNTNTNTNTSTSTSNTSHTSSTTSSAANSSSATNSSQNSNTHNANTQNPQHPSQHAPLSAFHAGHGHAPGISENQAVALDLLKAGAKAVDVLAKSGVPIPKPVSQAKNAAKAAKEVIEHPEKPWVQAVVCDHGVNALQALVGGVIAAKVKAAKVVGAALNGVAAVGAYEAANKLTDPVADKLKQKCNVVGDAIKQATDTLNQLKALPDLDRSVKQRDQVLDQTVQAVFKNRVAFLGRNPYFSATQKPSLFLNPSLPSWHDHLHTFRSPTPDPFQIRWTVRQFAGFTRPESVSSLCSRVALSLGVSDFDVRRELGSCHDIATMGGYAFNRQAWEDIKTRAFAGLLGSTGLSGDYNSYHPDSLMNAWLSSWGMIGGVAGRVAVIEGSAIGDFKEHMIALKMGQMPFTSAELQQISKELYDGIFIHNSYPFFSLDFHSDNSLFPLIHPCYERTLVGRVIGFLDAHLKGFLNGALYSDDLLQNWHLTANKDKNHLKTHLKDIKKLLPEYRSPREILCLMEAVMQSKGIPLAFDLTELGNRTSFRIIANQGKVERHENVFLIDPDFTVEYTIDLPPKVEEYVKSYRAKHGADPQEYAQLHAAHRLFAENLKKQMPTLPGLDRYFRMLGVINFLCYYYHTLKLSHQAPLLPSTTYSFPAFPKSLPPLPVRYYQQHKIHFTLEMLFEKLSPIKKEFDMFLFQQFWFEGEKEIPAQIEQACYNAIQQLLKKQIGQSDLDPKNVHSLADKCLAILMDVAMGIGESIFKNALRASNQTLLSAIRKKDEPVSQLYARIKLKEEKLQRQEDNAAKWAYIQQGIERAVRLIREELQESTEVTYQKDQEALAKLPSHVKNKIEHTLAKQHQDFLEKQEDGLKELKKILDDQALEIAQEIYGMSDELLKVPEIAEMPLIKQNYLHSVLEIPTTARDDMRIVGGCGMNLNRITPTSLPFGSRFVQASQGLPHNVFQQFKVGNENYVAFKMATKPFVQEECDGKVGQAEKELIESQGYTPLMIAALRGDEENAKAVLSQGGNPNVRLPSGMDALMLAIQNGEEQLALSLLKSNRISNISRPLENGMTPLHLAVQLKLPLVAQELIRRGAHFTAPRKLDDYTPLHLVAHFSNHPAIAALIPLMKMRGANMNLALPSSGKTPLHIAVERGIDPDFLIQAGANCDAQDKEGRTPLQCAILAGERDIALKLAKITTVGLKNTQGETASLLAARYMLFDVALKLLSRGEEPRYHVGPWKQDQKKRDVPYYAARQGSIQFLNFYGTQLFTTWDHDKKLLKISAQYGHGLFFCALLTKTPLPYDLTLFADLAAMDDAGSLGRCVTNNLDLFEGSLTFFLGAIERGNRLLLPHFPFNHKNSKQALISAMKGGNAPYFARVWQEIENRSSLDPKQLAIGLNLAHEAVKYGRIDILKQLYRLGMPMNLVNSDEVTPGELARQYQDDDLVALFDEFGVHSHTVETKESKESPNESLKDSSKGSKASKGPHKTQVVPPKRASEALVKKMQQLLRVPRLKPWNDWVRMLDPTLLFNGLPLLHHVLKLDPDSHGHFAKSAMQHLANSRRDPLLKDETSKPLSFVLLDCQTEGELKTKLGWIQDAFPQYFTQMLAQTDDKGLNLCDQIILKGSSKLLKALDRKVPSERSLHYAAMRGDVEMIRHLIDSEVPCECFDEKIYQPLHYAAQMGQAEIVEELLNHRVNPFLGTRHQNLPLHLAIMNKHVETAQRLIDYMPNPDRPNREGYTPLMLAAMDGCIPLIVRLIPCSNLYAVDAQGRNALHLAALHDSQEGVKTLLKHGMKIDVGTSQMHKGQESGFTTLYLAAIKGHLELFRFLLSKGANIHCVGTENTTILDGMVASNSALMHTELLSVPEFYQEAYQKSLPKTAAQRGNLAVLQELYLMGVPLDRFDEDGMAPIHYAVLQQHHAVVHFLLEHGVPAELPTADNLHKTPSDLATSESMKQLIAPFLNASVLPAAVPPMKPTQQSSPSFRQSDPVPYDFRAGLTAQELALIENSEDRPACCMLASRVKQELGIEVLYRILSKKHRKYQLQPMKDHALRIQIMTLALEIGDFTELTEPLLQGVFLEDVHDLMQEVYQKKMAGKQPARTPVELAKLFSEKSSFVDEPLSTQEANQLSALYQRLCDFAPACRQKSQMDLAKLARTTQEPLEAIAAIVESIRRIFKITPYDTQLFALLALIQPVSGCKGRMGQIRTGEGKSTIIAMLAAYHVVRGRKVDIVTTTHSLGKRDQEKYQTFYRAMEVTSSHICTRQPEKREFNGEVLYGTNSDFEFALLRQELYDNQARYALGSCRPQDVVIIDEVDSLFLDLALQEAHLAEPVPDLDDSWLYKPYLEWIRTHKHYDFKAVKQHLAGEKDSVKKDSKKDSKRVLSDEELRPLFDTGKQALEYEEYVDYMVKQEHIVPVDYNNTGSPHEGCRWPKGLHEFLEAKHDVPVKARSLRVASVSHVAFFRQYKTLIGLSGTIGEVQEREEIRHLYNVDLFDVPPHFPGQLVNMPSRLVSTEIDYYKAILQSVHARLQEGRPVLILLHTIQDTRKMAEKLKEENVEPQLLTAFQQEEEAYLLTRAGQGYVVTVATNAAGRGTDIILSEESKRAGGLHVIFGFCPINLRVQRQGEGRAGRQGQPGTSEIIAYVRSPSVQSILEPAGRTSCQKWDMLMKLRTSQVQALSLYRITRAERSIVLFEMLSDFLKLRKVIEESFEGNSLKQSLYRQALSISWSQFYGEMEESRLKERGLENGLERDELFEAYARFREGIEEQWSATFT